MEVFRCTRHIVVLAAMLCGLAIVTHGRTPVTEDAPLCGPFEGGVGEYNPPSCREERIAFLTKYPKVRKNDRGYITLCKLYLEFHTCMEKHLEKCPTERAQYNKHWKHVSSFMNHACVRKSQEYIDEFACIRKTQKTVLVERCTDVYFFKKDQDVFDHCELLREAVSCRHHMLLSECGERAGNLVFHLSKLAMLTMTGDYSCQIHKKKDYTGFVFTDKCRPGLGEELYTCYSDHVDGKVEYFDYSIVAKTNRNEVRKVCRSFRRYNKCVASLAQNCPDGVDMVYGLFGEMRTNFYKFDHMCGKHGSDYTSNMKCYQDTVNSTALRRCEPIFKDDIIPLLSHMNAHDFYCGQKLGDPAVIKVHKHMNRLKECYKNVFSKDCGKSAGKTISRLMSGIFTDPLYLKFKMKFDDSSITGVSKNRNKRSYKFALKCQTTIPAEKSSREDPKTSSMSAPEASSQLPTSTRNDKYGVSHRVQSDANQDSEMDSGQGGNHRTAGVAEKQTRGHHLKDREDVDHHEHHGPKHKTGAVKSEETQSKRGQRGHREQQAEDDTAHIVYAPGKEEFAHKDTSVKIGESTSSSGHRPHSGIYTYIAMSLWMLQMALQGR